jgi:hypothetical protein
MNYGTRSVHKLGLIAAAATGLSLSTGAFAVAPTTIAELTAGISFADVSLGILAVAGLMVTLYVGWRAAKFVIAAVKGL